MESGSELSVDDADAAKLLIGMTDRPFNPAEVRTVRPSQNQENDIEGYIEQSSLADDDEKDMIIEADQESYQDATELEQPTANYPLPLFHKASGESILQLTHLYSPVQATQAYYDKCSLIKRVCKQTNSQNDYYNYTRNLREYKSQLGDFYSGLLTDISFVTLQDDLMAPKKDYQKKILLKRLKELDSMIKVLETYEPSNEVPTMLPGKAFYNIKNSDFTNQIVWIDKKPVSKRLGSEKIIKGTETKDTTMLNSPESFLYINNNEKEVPALKKIFSFEPKDLSNVRLASNNFLKFTTLPIKSTKISFEFSKRPGKPGKYEIAPVFSKASETWGEIQPKKRESDSNYLFSVKKRKLLFHEELPEVGGEAPTNVNSLFKEHYWKDLVFDRNIYRLKERYGKLVMNPLDPNNMNVKVIEDSEDDEHENDEYSDEGYDRDDEFESKIDKSLLSESSIMGAKNAELSMRSKVTTLKHANPAYDYPFIKTEWTKQELRNFHRPEVYLTGKKWSIRLPKFIPSSPAHDFKGENIAAHSTLMTPKQLSIKDGPFLLMEYLEKRPPLLNNFGMSSKIKRYYKGAKKAPEEYPEYIGTLGSAEYIESNKQFPLIGNLSESSGLSVFEGNLFRVPLYFHHSRSTDFLIIRYQKRNGKYKWYLRQLEHLCTTGQLEPKVDVMAPNARLTNSFQQKRIQAFIYKALDENSNRIELRDVSQNFTSINESTIRKQMKTIKCEQQPDGSWICMNPPSKQEYREMITPEEICQYESMLAGQRRLKDKGIKITSIDKVPNAIQKLKKEMDNKEISYWADFIEEELTVTPWNLTSSYLKTKGEKGMMRITGVGDPTHGSCGFSFVRLPMKLPNSEKTSAKNDPSDYLPTNMTVTGTSADLRTLTKDDVNKILVNLGCRKDELTGLGRWSGVSLLRSISSKLVSEGYKGAVEKYARGIRMSTKMQKEQCQKTIDEIFHRQIKILGEKREFYSDKSTDSEDDVLAKQVAENIKKPIEEKGKRIDMDEDIELSEKQHLEEFKTTKNNFSTVSNESTKAGVRKVLKRTTRMPNLKGTVTVRIVYITDPAEIEDYYKRKAEEDQPKIKEKIKRTADTIEQKLLKISDPKRKKKKEGEFDSRKEEKRLLEEKKSLERTNVLSQQCLDRISSGEIAGSAASKIVCGKCGMPGHMKTNRKKCPMYTPESAESFRADQEGMVKMEGSKIKLDIEKIQQAAEKKKEEHFYGDYSRPKTISARRRRLIEENPYDDIAFKLIRFDHTKIFINPVKKEIYPDYYVLIKNPVDLSSMNAKAKRGEYTSAQSFIEDLDTIVANSTLYNGALHDVTFQAIQIKEEGLRLLRDKELLVDIPETSNEYAIIKCES